MRDIVVVKNIRNNLAKKMLYDFKEIFIQSPWIMLIAFSCSLFMFEFVFKHELFLRLPLYFQAIVTSLFAFWFILFGYTFTRDCKTLNSSSGLVILLGDTLLNMLSFPYLKPLRFLGGLAAASATPYLLGYVDVLSWYPPKMAPSPAMLGMFVFIVVAGLFTLKSQDIFMNWDGIVKVEDKRGSYNSKSKTEKVVKEYRAINKKVNFDEAIALTGCSTIVLGVFLNNVFAPIMLIVFAMLFNLAYTYSFSKAIAAKDYTGPWVITDDLAEKVDEDEFSKDANIQSEEDSQKAVDETKKVKQSLTKEKILGEDWYLNDRKSVLEDEIDEDSPEGENGEILPRDDNSPSPNINKNVL